jgi:hypothetical protein
MADRIGERLKLLVAAQQLLVEHGHLLRLAQHDVHDGGAQLQRGIAVDIVPRQRLAMHRLLPALERGARRQWLAGVFLAWVAAPAHRAHDFRAEPQYEAVVDLGDGNGQYAAGDVREGIGRLPVQWHPVCAEQVALLRLGGQPLHQLHHLVLAGAIAMQNAFAPVHDRRAAGVSQR